MNNNQFSECYKCGQPEKFVKFVGSKEIRVCTNMCKVKNAEKAVDYMYNEETKPFPIGNGHGWKSEAR